MPAELRAGWVPPIKASTFEQVFGSDSKDTRKPWTGVASWETRVKHAQAMPRLTEFLGLSDEEETLTLALAAALDAGLEHVAEMVLLSRVSREDVQAHASEVGVERMLTACVKAGIVRVVVLMHAVEKLGVVSFEGALPGRSLLGYNAIVVRDSNEWQAVLKEVVAWCYVKCIGTVYDHVLLFGFGGTSDRAKFSGPRADSEKTNGTGQKERALMRAKRLVFTEKTMASNLKRLTNGRTKPKPKPDALLALLAASEFV
jgi:hypothetical protein